MWNEHKQYNQRSVRNDKNTFKGHLQHIEKERNINNIFLNKHQFLDHLHILWAYATHAIHNRILTLNLNLSQNVSKEWGSFLYYKAGSQLLQNEVSADYKLG